LASRDAGDDVSRSLETMWTGPSLCAWAGPDAERDEEHFTGLPASTPVRIVAHGVVGDPAAEAGVQRVYLQLLDLSDLEHLQFFAAEVMPRFQPAR
jgi:hypothetical protein